jgi:Zn-dependent protease
MLFIQRLFIDPENYFIWIFLVIFSVCCHEYAHAQIALWEGDSTAADNGYLTINPFKQMGLTSLIALLLIGITWGAVPVNPSRMRHRYSDALVAVAGPLMNLLLFLVFSIGASIVYLKTAGFAASNTAFNLFFTGGVLNMVLLIFNLLPVPPLDGWSIFTFLFPHIHKVNPEMRNGIIFGLFILVFFSFGKLFVFGGYAVLYVIQVMIPFLKTIGV